MFKDIAIKIGYFIGITILASFSFLLFAVNVNASSYPFNIFVNRTTDPNSKMTSFTEEQMNTITNDILSREGTPPSPYYLIYQERIGLGYSTTTQTLFRIIYFSQPLEFMSRQRTDGSSGKYNFLYEQSGQDFITRNYTYKNSDQTFVSRGNNWLYPNNYSSDLKIFEATSTLSGMVQIAHLIVKTNYTGDVYFNDAVGTYTSPSFEYSEFGKCKESPAICTPITWTSGDTIPLSVFSSDYYTPSIPPNRIYFNDDIYSVAFYPKNIYDICTNCNIQKSFLLNGSYYSYNFKFNDFVNLDKINNTYFLKDFYIKDQFNNFITNRSNSYNILNYTDPVSKNMDTSIPLINVPYFKKFYNNGELINDQISETYYIQYDDEFFGYILFNEEGLVISTDENDLDITYTDETNTLITINGDDYNEIYYPEYNDLNYLDNISGFLPTNGLDALITLPLTFTQSVLNALTNNSCYPVVVPLPFINQDLTLPCMSGVYSQMGVGAIITAFGGIISAFLLFNYFKYLYKWIDDTLSLRENSGGSYE